MLTLLLALGTAQAYDLDGHRALSERTAELAAAKDPSVAPYASVLVAASVYEDLDLVTKWGRYSHYYDPEHTLTGMRRLTSRDRVDDLSDELDRAIVQGDAAEAWWVAGRLLHHVQDMASPPHVVPVPHNTTDGFESYDTAGLVAGVGRRTLPPMSGRDAHQALAMETKRLVEQGGWPLYWEGKAGTFGRYGAVGNTFGETTDAERERVERAFITGRAEAAVAYGQAFVRDTARRLTRRDAPLVAQAGESRGPIGTE